MIDGFITMLYSIHGNYAKGAIVKGDLTLRECFIAKAWNFFAHGETLHEATEAALEKYNDNKPEEDRIADFVAKYPTVATVVGNRDLFQAHHVLTGSCLFGRQQFAKEHGIDVKCGSMTVGEFIELTKEAYGGETIKRLGKRYREDEA